MLQGCTAEIFVVHYARLSKAGVQIMAEAVMVSGAKSGRPGAEEHGVYYGKYISLVTGDDVVAALEMQRRETLVLLSSLSEADGDFRYAAEKWSVKEVLGHVNDTERIMSYRALRIGRGDNTPLPGYEQDDYVKTGEFGRMSVEDLLEEYIAVRRATLSLLRHFDDAAWQRTGVASENPASARALAYIVAGHELHHRRILEEKYFVKRG
jgi:hypothetical protein